MTAIEIPTPDPRTLDDTIRPFAEAVSGQFAIKKLIGSGGMGMVFLARDRRLDRLVAIKTLPPTLAKDAAVRERFLRETRTAGSLTHANIVPIHGADEVDGHVYFVMAYVDGDSLATLVRANDRLTPRAVAGYMRDVASALSFAHQRGVIHRDVKAENILVEHGTGRALVTDFGIARLAEAKPLTITGQVLGTVYYMSPEQVSGEALDGRSDIYSLGVVGFLALTGRFPFTADVASAVLIQHVTRTAPPVASVNRSLPVAMSTIIDRCLQRDPAHRYANADELIAALNTAMPHMDDAPVVVSNTEAHSVWKRAAELQANTGIQPRPDAVPQPRKQAKSPPSAAKPGFRVDQVVAAASEAGIDERYVDHALVEHGLAGAPVPAPAPALTITTSPAPEKSKLFFWNFSKYDARAEAKVAGELSVRDFDRLINIVRDQTDRLGTTTAQTREVAWNTRTPIRHLLVSIVPAQGQTTITLQQRVRGPVVLLAAILSVMLAIPIGMAIGASLMAFIGRGGEDFGALVGVLCGTASALVIGDAIMRGIYARVSRKLGKFANLLATVVRDSIRQ